MRRRTNRKGEAPGPVILSFSFATLRRFAFSCQRPAREIRDSDIKIPRVRALCPEIIGFFTRSFRRARAKRPPPHLIRRARNKMKLAINHIPRESVVRSSTCVRAKIIKADSHRQCAASKVWRSDPVNPIDIARK